MSQDTTYSNANNLVYDDIRDVDIKHKTRKRKREDDIKIRTNCNKKRHKYTQGMSEKTWNRLNTDNQLDIETDISEIELQQQQQPESYYYSDDDDFCGGKYCVGCGCCYGIRYRLFD